MKVLDLCCANRHRFEGWFASTDDFVAQSERQLVTCPICNDASIARMPSAPRLNRSKSQDAPPAAAAAVDRPAPNPDTAAQAEWLHAMRKVLSETEDVGDRFASEARRIHRGDAESRGIRGRATKDEAEALRDEGIAVTTVALPEALKGPVH